MRQNDGAGQGKNEQLLTVNAVHQRAAPNNEQAYPMGPGANNHDEKSAETPGGYGVGIVTEMVTLTYFCKGLPWVLL
jgi:hypothetical protein